MTTAFCVVLSTAGNKEEAEHLSEMLVSRCLAACVQMVHINSIYSWQDKIDKEAEVLLLIKTATHLYSEVETAILENHSYETPEIIQIPITQGLPGYLEWVEESIKSS
ncbi:MAG: divalent-cation tolerance protein CutA [Anaerolineales bacterium]|nr:divalent-cation tolerance protein CutA [Anaerolineales bacterium]